MNTQPRVIICGINAKLLLALIRSSNASSIPRQLTFSPLSVRVEYTRRENEIRFCYLGKKIRKI